MEDARLTLTVTEAARLLGIGRGLAYQLVRERRIPTIRLGRRLVVPRAALEKMLSEVGDGREDNSPFNQTTTSSRR